MRNITKDIKNEIENSLYEIICPFDDIESVKENILCNIDSIIKPYLNKENLIDYWIDTIIVNEQKKSINNIFSINIGLQYNEYDNVEFNNLKILLSI